MDKKRPRQRNNSSDDEEEHHTTETLTLKHNNRDTDNVEEEEQTEVVGGGGGGGGSQHKQQHNGNSSTSSSSSSIAGAEKRMRGDGSSSSSSSTALVAISSSALVSIPGQHGAGSSSSSSSCSSSLGAPSMLLTGHGGGITGLDFDATGENLLSCSKDKTVFLWKASGECDNYALIRGHKNAILEAHWCHTSSSSSSSATFITASADKTCGVWDAEAGVRIKTHAGHTKIVNTVCPLKDFGFSSRNKYANGRSSSSSCSSSSSGRGSYSASGSDDGTIRIWDARNRSSIATIHDKYPILSVVFQGDDASTSTLLSAGIEGVIKQYDLRKTGGGSSSSSSLSTPTLTLTGHTDTITSLAVDPDGTKVISASNDGGMRMWDIRPFVSFSSSSSSHGSSGGGSSSSSQQRFLRSFVGFTNNFEMNLLRCAWSPDGNLVACGSADRNAWVWDAETGKTVHVLPGHTGTVTCVAFHPRESVLASGGVDKQIYIGDI